MAVIVDIQHILDVVIIAHQTSLCDSMMNFKTKMAFAKISSDA